MIKAATDKLEHNVSLLHSRRRVCGTWDVAAQVASGVAHPIALHLTVTDSPHTHSHMGLPPLSLDVSLKPLPYPSAFPAMVMCTLDPTRATVGKS
eukprot:CAMPEP_0181181866 /NCGR_PEP_ID=MMETSP1096-20121128/7568_1 /TAXON_ID=156174 ORGANISM="Chrysochromulina ericina, Strain CCMP281" /NCGR_SAMPLE_ID=MMETSP1096 /ASSEMBLY_ACC=CAM_ASM_000453 /LENGTH=94 /DNA_ID=CAMNT_0023270403 /DNA_START=255 /DNA_END=535 /DNA_ORIENTATION=-